MLRFSDTLQIFCVAAPDAHFAQLSALTARLTEHHVSLTPLDNALDIGAVLRMLTLPGEPRLILRFDGAEMSRRAQLHTQDPDDAMWLEAAPAVWIDDGDQLRAPRGAAWVWPWPPSLARLREILDHATERARAWSAAYERVPLPLLLVDRRDQRVIHANQRAVALLGASPTHRALTALLDIAPGVLSGDVPWSGVCNLHGTEREVQVHLASVSQRMCALTVQDATHLRRQHAKDEEERRLIVVGKMTSAITHEIGNPLAALKTTLQVLQRNLDRFSPAKTQDYVRRVLAEINRLDAIIRDFLTFARPLHTSLDAPEPVDLDALTAQLSRDLDDTLRHHNIRLALDLHPAARWALGSTPPLRQVLLNLVLNALESIQATGRGDGTIDLITVPSHTGQLTIIVRDDGEGLDPSTRARVFETFFTTKGSGTGLGLVVCRQIVEALGGTITLNPRRDGTRGCTVRVTLPREERA